MSAGRGIRWRQLRIGIAATSVLILLSVAVFFIDQIEGLLQDRYTLQFRTLTTQAVRSRSPVWFAGQPVGEVRRLEFEPPTRGRTERLRVILSIHRAAQPYILEGSSAQIITSGRIGQTVVNILPPEDRGPPLPDGGVLETAAELDVVDLGRRLKSATDSLVPVLDRWRRVLERAHGGPGTLASLGQRPEELRRLRDTLAELTRFFADVRAVADRTLGIFTAPATRGAFARIEGRLKRLEKQWEAGGGTAGALARDTLLLERLARIRQRSDRLDRRLQTGRGSLGRYLNDRALIDEWTETLRMLRQLRNDLRRLSDGSLTELR